MRKYWIKLKSGEILTEGFYYWMKKGNTSPNIVSGHIEEISTLTREMQYYDFFALLGEECRMSSCERYISTSEISEFILKTPERLRELKIDSIVD